MEEPMNLPDAGTPIAAAIRRYFDLMYDCDVTKFDQVFHSTAQLHGMRDGALVVWPAATYRDILEKRHSPKTAGAPREEQILMIDVASPDQALLFEIAEMRGLA
jgi:Putative lumazine-binding